MTPVERISDKTRPTGAPVEEIRGKVREVIFNIGLSPDRHIVFNEYESMAFDGKGAHTCIDELCTLISSILDGLVMDTPHIIEKQVDANIWLRDQGVDDGDTFSAAEVSELLENYTGDLLRESNSKISTIQSSLKGKQNE
jgi:hypothetical protein